MQAQEEFGGSDDHSIVIKGKRTKRQRSNSPLKAAAATAPATSSSSSSGAAIVAAPPAEDYNSSMVSSSPATSAGEIYESTEEEEDMANCLIMLAQGNNFNFEKKDKDVVPRKFDGSRKFSEIATTTNKAGFFVYECKTCNRSFPSFQALGGHRASHKKPKTNTGEEKNKPVKVDPEEGDQIGAPILALQMGGNCQNKPNFRSSNTNNKAKVHECSICGAEFSSGQALGGHMRRHRAAAIGNQAAAVSVETTSNTVESSNGTDEIKQRNILALDLNLPAPEDDHHLHDSSKFQFGTSQPSALVFPAPALVDCHY